MGGDNSKSFMDDYFILEHPTRLALDRKKKVEYYWLESRITEQNIQTISELRSYFSFDQVLSVKALQKELAVFTPSSLVKIIAASTLPSQDYDYLSQEQKVLEVILFQGGDMEELRKKHTKIVAYCSEVKGLIEKLLQLEAKQDLKLPITSILLLDSDTKILNCYRLNYQCITREQNRQKSKEDFIAIANRIFPQQNEQIARFKKEYSEDLKGEELYKQVLQWAFEDNFYFKLVEQFPKATVDCKKLGYLRLAFKDLHQAIFETFKVTEPAKFQVTFLVVDLNTDEKHKLLQSKGNFVIFTSFVKGYMKQAEAVAEWKKRPTSFLITIIANNKRLEKSLNVGFSIKQNRIIYNIYNFFRVEEVELNIRKATVLYGGLAQAFATSLVEEGRMKLSPAQFSLLRNFDYLQDTIKRFNTQASLLQLSGHFKESLHICEKKVDEIRRSKTSEQMLENYVIQKGEALRMSGDFEEAAKEYESVKGKMKLIALVRLAQLYFIQGRPDELEKDLKQLQPHLKELEQISKEEYFRAQNYFALRLMNQQKHTEARAKFKSLHTELAIFYNLRFQGRPLVHEVKRNLATCESYLNNHEEALNLLTETIKWQKDCQGNSASVARTQVMILAVSRSKGDAEKIKQSKMRLSEINKSIEPSERKFLNRSLISVEFPGGLPNEIEEGLPAENIEQSTIGIHF